MSNTKPKQTKAAVLAQVQGLIAGTQKHFSNGSFTFGNVSYTAATLVPLLQKLADAMAAANAAEVQAQEAAAAERTASAQVGPIVTGYKRFVLASFEGSPSMLADFDVPAPKPRTPLTTEQKIAAVAKAKATRQARGTTSKKKKLAISGSVTGVIVTPVTAPAAAPSAPSPAAPSAAPAATGK